MKLVAEMGLPFPRDLVFAAYRDDIGSILEFLPNVRAVEVKARKEEGTLVKQINEWYGGGEVSAAVRGIVTQSMLRWRDLATWDGAAFSCDWWTESHTFPDGVRCRGRTSFIATSKEQSKVEMLGAVEVDARRFPGVPGFLAGSVGRSVEEFLCNRIRANLVDTAKWFEKNRGELRLRA